MKKVLVLPLMALLVLGAAAQTKTVKKPVARAAAKPTATIKPLKTPLDSLSYAFGVSLGEFLKNQGVASISYPLLNLAISKTRVAPPGISAPAP